MKSKLVRYRNLFIYNYYRLRAKFSSKSMPVNHEADFVVSIASYPKRDPLLPAVFQALSRQTVVPRKWILVLSVEDYFNGLPNHLKKLEKQGVKILLVDNNPYAVKKLLPTMEKYPEFDVITFDDELIYGRKVIERLTSMFRNNQGAIIGHVGKVLVKDNGKLGMMNRTGNDANLKTDSNQVYFLGGSGTYYPANSLDDKVFNLNAIHDIVPGRGSDIWFWAAAVAKGTRQICLGSKQDLSLYFAIPQLKITKPKDRPGAVEMNRRFNDAIDFFGIREKLLEVLPDNKSNEG